MSRPSVRYLEVDGLQLAYQVVGDGPIDLILVDEWATPLETRWDVPAIAGRLERLASFARVISFDKRGIGLSDSAPSEELATPEIWVRDVVAVADEVGAERPVLFGTHEGGPIALLFAASLPLRTQALILVNTGPRLTATQDWPHGFPEDDWRPDIAGITKLWAAGTGGEYHITATAHDPWWRDWYARSRRQQAGPRAGLRLMQMFGELDVRHIAPAVQCPTLVVHRRDNAWWPLGGARWLAEEISDAELIELHGVDTYWWSGDADAVVDAVEAFLLGAPTSPPSERELATIMFTDIVDSTALATRIGDREWRALLDRHDAVTLAEIARHSGTPLKQLGDGYMAQFSGPAGALRAAEALHAAIEGSGLRLRIAIHTGEAERRGDDLSGVAVHLAARLLDVAEPGDTLVSDVVKGLVAGSGVRFAPRGTHRFKGLPDTWDLHAIDRPPSDAGAPTGRPEPSSQW